jgi:hypothetical protein
MVEQSLLLSPALAKEWRSGGGDGPVHGRLSQYLLDSRQENANRLDHLVLQSRIELLPSEYRSLFPMLFHVETVRIHGFVRL